MLVLAFVLAFAGGGSLALQLSDYLSPYKYETANADYYAAECYRLEFGKPPLSTHADSDDVKAQKGKAEAEWHKDYPPYCDLAAQFVAANSAKSSKNYAAWTMLLTALGVLLIWRTMVYTGGMLEAANKTLDQAIETTRQAHLATKAANATSLATERAAAQSQEIAIRQGAAFLLIDGLEINTPFKNPRARAGMNSKPPRHMMHSNMMYHAKFSNFGPSLAVDVVYWGEMVGKDMPDGKCGAYSAEVIDGKAIAEYPQSWAQIQFPAAGQKPFDYKIDVYQPPHILLRCEYTDIFGERRFTMTKLDPKIPTLTELAGDRWIFVPRGNSRSFGVVGGESDPIYPNPKHNP